MKNLLLIDEAFSSALEAFEYLRKPNRIEVVLSDLRMPGLSGEDVLRHVRAEFAELPVLIMSGHATDGDISRLKTLGLNAFLPKPFTPAQLSAAMATLANTKAA